MLPKPITRWQKLFTTIVVLFPILDIYSVGVKGIGIGSILISISFVVILFRHLKMTYNIQWNPYFLFFLYGLIISLITLLLHNEFSATAVSIRLTYFLFYTLLIFMPSLYDFNIRYACKVYLIAGFFCSVFLLVQYVSFFVFNHTLLGIIPGLPLNYSITDYNEWTDSYNNLYDIIFRATSIFPEPAAFAQYVSPLLVIILFTSLIEKKKLTMAGFFSIALFLSTSTNAIIFSVIIWIIYFLYRGYDDMKNKDGSVLLLPVIIVIFIALLFPMVMTDNPISNYTSQQLNDLFDIKTTSSAYLRVIRGFDIYTQLGLLEQIFGIGFGTYTSYYSMGSIYVLDGDTEYMSALSYLFVSSGIVGFFLFLFSLLYNVQKGGVVSKVLAFWIILIFTSSSIFHSPIYSLVYLFILHARFLTDE